MIPRTVPSRPELIQQALNARRHHENRLFDSDIKTPYFWKLSELSILYPNFFDTKNPVSAYTIARLNNTITDTIPEFSTLESQPVHVLSFRETYNIYSKESDKMKTVIYGSNQKLTNVACEYIFRQCNGAELEQAYFLYPHKKPEELTLAAQELRFERVRDQVAHTSNLLSAIIKRARGATRTSFSDTWAIMWRVLYDVNSMDVLRERYNIRTSPLDYMKLNTLVFINSILQEIVYKFTNSPYYNIEEVQNEIRTAAAKARARFFRYGSTPEAQFAEKNSYHIIEKIRRNREKFWEEYYPLSLIQK